MSIRQRLQNNTESIINILLICCFVFIISSCVADRKETPVIVTTTPNTLVICELPNNGADPVWVTSKTLIGNSTTYFSVLSKDKCKSMGGGYANV